MSRASLAVAPLLLSFAFAPFALALSACSGDKRLAYAKSSDPQGDTTATIDFAPHGSIVIAEGSAVSVHVQLVGNDGTNISGDLTIDDPSTLLLETTPTDPQRYVFLGSKAGSTTLRFLVGGRVGGSVPVYVTAPVIYTPPAWLTGADASAVPPDGSASPPPDASGD